MIQAANRFLRAPKSLRGPFETSAAALAALAGASLANEARAEDNAAPLPAMTVDQPAARKILSAPKPTKAHQRARAALRRATRTQAASAAPVAAPAANAAADPLQNLPGPSPYTRPGDPYMVLRVATSKYTEPLINTPRTITVLSKEIIADKNATSLKDLARTTAGVTLGTGEGGNAFGDRFFIRGFDARNDIFIDGVRDPGVSIRENFFTEQVEIMRGPGSTFSGRGTAGGAINIVPKMAQDQNFRSIETTFGTDNTKRATFDINQVINSDLAVRAGGMLQGASVSGRDTTTDDRNGAFASVKWTPGTSLIVEANYIHSYLTGIPDFGVPYYRASNAVTGAPVTELGVNRNAYYGFANRDYQTAQQDIGTLNAIYKVNENVQVSNKLRFSESTLDYIGTLPQSITSTNKNPLLWTVNTSPQSRYQTTTMFADQTEATIRFNTGDYKHALVIGTEISQESVSIDKYSGLSSEAYGSASSGTGAVTGVSLFYPQYTYLPFPNFNPTLSGNPTYVTVNTGSAYLIDTLNYNDKVFLNGGVRVDDYYINSWNWSGANEAHSTLINYNLGALVKPTQETSLYAAWATSSNPVGAEVDATASAYGGLAPTATNAVFGPELNTAAEIGAKAELFDRQMLATAALFQTTKTNARETNGSTVTAGAAYWVRGIDLEVGGKITPQWSMFGGLVLMQSEVTASQTSPSNTVMYYTNLGLPLANIAHQSFNLLTKYEIDHTWEVGGQATYRSQIYGGTLAANTGAVLPAYWRFDAFVEAKITQNLTAKLSVNNITNELYYDSFYRSLSPFVMVAPGRVALLSLNARF